MAARAGNPGPILEWLFVFVAALLPITVLLAVTQVHEPDQVVIPRRKPSFLQSMKVIRRNGTVRVICKEPRHKQRQG